MSLTCEIGALLVKGGLADQPRWYVNLLAWFAPAYDMQKFMQKAQMVLGDGSDTKQNASAKKPQRKR